MDRRLYRRLMYRPIYPQVSRCSFYCSSRLCMYHVDLVLGLCLHMSAYTCLLAGFSLQCFIFTKNVCSLYSLCQGWIYEFIEGLGVVGAWCSGSSKGLVGENFHTDKQNKPLKGVGLTPLPPIDPPIDPIYNG